MNTPDVRPFILARMQRRAKLPPGVDLTAFDYIESGHVDSIAITKFILDVEDAFNIEITDAEMTSCAFRTVDGLIGLIERKLDRCDRGKPS